MSGGARREPPLVAALRDPDTLLDRFVLGIMLGPPRVRASFELPALRALARRGRRPSPPRQGSDDDG